MIRHFEFSTFISDAFSVEYEKFVSNELDELTECRQDIVESVQTYMAIFCRSVANVDRRLSPVDKFSYSRIDWESHRTVHCLLWSIVDTPHNECHFQRTYGVLDSSISLPALL